MLLLHSLSHIHLHLCDGLDWYYVGLDGKHDDDEGLCLGLDGKHDDVLLQWYHMHVHMNKLLSNDLTYVYCITKSLIGQSQIIFLF